MLRLKAERLRRGLSQSQAAQLMGVTLPNFYGWESGVTKLNNMRYGSAVRLSQLFGLPPETLFAKVPERERREILRLIKQPLRGRL
jgi:transcriptional regulator with XRE-family HTH domain